mmetsp:Transcript_36493/g.103065  ORF Transcript_36493/g.103065 Transcript_36493/m.103065 type:complete len:111 (+) Transcript_36493:1196-1528(+)
MFAAPCNCINSICMSFKSMKRIVVYCRRGSSAGSNVAWVFSIIVVISIIRQLVVVQVGNNLAIYKVAFLVSHKRFFLAILSFNERDGGNWFWIHVESQSRSPLPPQALSE